MIKGLIFDLDGVLCYTDEYHYKAWKKLADELGIEFNREINKRLLGVSRMESLEIILEKSNKKYSDEEKEALAVTKNDYYKTYLEEIDDCAVADGCSSVLNELKNRGYKLAVGSSSKNTPVIMEKLDLAKYFNAVSDGNNIIKSKPDPEVFLKAAEFLNLKPEECLVVEDALSGVEAARRAGMACACVGEASLKKAGDYNMTTLMDLLKVVD